MNPRGWVTSGRSSECSETDRHLASEAGRHGALYCTPRAPGAGGLSLAFRSSVGGSGPGCRTSSPVVWALGPPRAGGRLAFEAGEVSPAGRRKDLSHARWGDVEDLARHAVRVQLSLQKQSKQRQRRTAP